MWRQWEEWGSNQNSSTEGLGMFWSNTILKGLSREMCFLGCLPFTWKNRLVDGFCKWDASIQYISRLEISTGMRLFRLQNCSFNYRASLELVGFQDDGGNAANECAFSIRKFRLGILDYLSRNFVFPWKFPFGKKKNSLPIYIPSEISGFFA